MKKHRIKSTSIQKNYDQENQDEYNIIEVWLLSDVAKSFRKYKINFDIDSLGFY